MKYFSTFSGIAGFELGIKQAHDNNFRHKTDDKGKSAEDISQYLPNTQCDNVERTLQCVGYSEIDKYAVSIYKKHFPEHRNYGNITTITADSLPDFDILVGGFPCQAFSIAGKRKGFEDTRGTLFFDLARILKAKRPRYFVFENVKGLLSHDNGSTFRTIIATITELGYDCQWQVLNSKNHGVPQNRERVFIVGHLRGSCRPEVFPFRETDSSVNEGCIKGDSKVETSQTIRTRYGNGSGSHIYQINQPKHSNDRIYNVDGISPTLNTMQGGRRQPFIPSGSKIRRLTPTECERLQGFPDKWTEKGVNEKGNEVLISDTQRYKCIGNAVTVNVIKDIFEKILQ